MKKAKRNRRNKNEAEIEKDITLKDKTAAKGSLSRENILVAATVVGIAYLAFPFMVGFGDSTMGWKQEPKKAFKTDEFQKSAATSMEERLMEEWPTGGRVQIKKIGEGNRGLFTTRNIAKGEVIASVNFPDLEQELRVEHRTLRPIVEKTLQKVISDQHANLSTLTSGKVLSLIKFIMEYEQGEASVWHSFIESLPRNVSAMAWYWSDDEKKCIVPRPDSEILQQDLRVYHAVMEIVKQSFPPLAEIYSRQTVEWAYLMLKTRGFGQYFLPVLHLANHNPLEAVPAFLMPNTGRAAYVATHNMKAGDPVYTSYGSLSPVVSAEQYGFVESVETSAFFEVPSIHEDILQHERTKNEPLCTREPVKFFGNVTTQVVGTKYKNAGKSTYFKAFMPTELTYACIRVRLQTERDTDVARYIYEKLKVDLNRYEAMASAASCQSSEGNFPLIQQANQVTAQLMRGALEVAEKGKDWKIPYPDIPTYIMNTEY